MLVDSEWAERNIGFDPAKGSVPVGAFADNRVASSDDLEDFACEIIDFDSEGPEGAAFIAATKSTGLGRFTDIPWPTGLAPVTGGKPGRGAGPLPRADALVATRTVDEGHALSRVLTPPRIELLNHFRITSEGGSLPAFGQACERLVAYLALEDRHLSRDRIAGALWPDTVQSRAAANLRRALSLVRRHAPGLVRSDARCLSLVSGVSVDARAQRDLIGAITGGERTTASADELRLLRGDLLPDWDEPWLVESREELRQLRLISVEALSAAHLEQGRPAFALAVALCVACDEPLRESAQRLVIKAHLAQGNWAEAARHYMNYRTLLWAELRLRPGTDIEELMRPVLTHSATGQRTDQRSPVGA